MKTLVLSLALLFSTAGAAHAETSSYEGYGEVIPVKCAPEWVVHELKATVVLTCPDSGITMIVPRAVVHGKTRSQLRKAAARK